MFFAETCRGTGRSREPDETGPGLLAEIGQSLDATKVLTSVHVAVRTTGKVDSLLGAQCADVDVRLIRSAAKGGAPTTTSRGVLLSIAKTTSR